MDNKNLLSDEALDKVIGGREMIVSGVVIDRNSAGIGKPYIWGSAGPEGYDDAGSVKVDPDTKKQ